MDKEIDFNTKTGEFMIIKEDKDMSKNEKQTIFIIHAENDGNIARAFCNMLESILRTHIHIKREIACTSLPGYPTGGGDSFEEILAGIDRSNNVFCLLTKTSFNKPWILYEMGYTMGKHPKKNLIPIRIGIDYDNHLNSKPYSRLSVKPYTKDELLVIIINLLKNINNITDINDEAQLKKDSGINKHIKDFIKKVNEEIAKSVSINCPKCNIESVPHAKFCHQCGKKLTVPTVK